MSHRYQILMSNRTGLNRTHTDSDQDLEKILRDLEKTRATTWYVVTDLRTNAITQTWTRPGHTIPKWWR